MLKLNIKSKRIFIENTSGDNLLVIDVNEQGEIHGMVNAEVADVIDNEVRIQMIDDIK